MRAAVCVVSEMLVAALPAARAETRTKLAPLDPVRTVHVATVNQASDAGLYVAIEKGYFAEPGRKVDLVTFTNAATMIAPLGSGEHGMLPPPVREIRLRASLRAPYPRPLPTELGLARVEPILCAGRAGATCRGRGARPQCVSP